jgi:RND family efflux transporter MFP subunit
MRKKIIIGTIIAITAVGLFGYNWYRLNQSIPVTLVDASEGIIRESVYASGKLESMEERSHFIPISGTIDQVAVQVGDHVTAGQTLLTIDIQDWEEQIRMEENNREMILAEQRSYRKQALENAKLELIAGKQADDILDKEQLAMHQLRLEQNTMTVESLKQKISARELKAEIDGVVVEVAVKKGQVASQGLGAILITKTDDLRVTAFLNELDAGKVKQGMEVSVTGDAFPSEFAGKLTYLAPVAALADQTSRDPSVELWVELEGENAELKPGYNAAIEILVSEDPNLQLPLSAVRQKNDKAYVYTIENGLAVEKEVSIGKDDGEQIEILDGLSAGEQVIGELPVELAAGKKVKSE